MSTPLVSVICLCYNHARFVEESVRSVIGQTWPNVQLIIVDDSSTDNSREVINKLLTEFPSVEFVSTKENEGNCKAFNLGLKLAKGDFIIDLAADDVLLPDRIVKGVAALNEKGPTYGVQFSDAELIDELGNRLGFHSDRFPHASVPQGDVYEQVLDHYFINSPTMMIRREVFAAIGGYDETLAYEDFDLWVRSSREFFYCYVPEALVKRRKLVHSMGAGQYKRGTKQLQSTFKVCEKAFQLNRNHQEHLALRKRIYYEARQAFFLGEFALVWKYVKLLSKIP